MVRHLCLYNHPDVDLYAKRTPILNGSREIAAVDTSTLPQRIAQTSSAGSLQPSLVPPLAELFSELGADLHGLGRYEADWTSPLRPSERLAGCHWTRTTTERAEAPTWWVDP